MTALACAPRTVLMVIQFLRPSLLVNIILGIAGGCVGGFLFRILGFAATGLVGTIISGVVGSIVLIYIGKKFFK